MAHRLVVLEWLYKADQDYGFARVSMEKTDYFDQICLLFQQAAEKYLKAYIVKFNLKFEKMHDLVKLLKICNLHDQSLKILEESCNFLTPFYFETRYADNVFAVCTKDQAIEAHRHTKKIQLIIREKLGVLKEVTLKGLKIENDKIDRILKNNH